MNIYEYKYVSIHIHLNTHQTCTYIGEYTLMHGYTAEYKCMYAYQVIYACIWMFTSEYTSKRTYIDKYAYVCVCAYTSEYKLIVPNLQVCYSKQSVYVTVRTWENVH
jgi:hypothetical protein